MTLKLDCRPVRENDDEPASASWKMTTGELQALSLVGFVDELAISAATKRPAQLFVGAQYRGGTEWNGTVVPFPFS